MKRYRHFHVLSGLIRLGGVVSLLVCLGQPGSIARAAGEAEVVSFSPQGKDLVKEAGDQVRAVAFAPDGTLLAVVTGGEGGNTNQGSAGRAANLRCASANVSSQW